MRTKEFKKLVHNIAEFHRCFIDPIVIIVPIESKVRSNILEQIVFSIIWDVKKNRVSKILF